MQLTDAQRARLEFNIVRFMRKIPNDVEVTGKDWLTGLEIDLVEHSCNNVYRVWYSWEDENNKLCKNDLFFTATFLENVVRDIVFADSLA